MYLYIYIYTHAVICICIYICVCVYVYIYIYTPINTLYPLRSQFLFFLAKSAVFLATKVF